MTVSRVLGSNPRKIKIRQPFIGGTAESGHWIGRKASRNLLCGRRQARRDRGPIPALEGKATPESSPGARPNPPRGGGRPAPPSTSGRRHLSILLLRDYSAVVSSLPQSVRGSRPPRCRSPARFWASRATRKTPPFSASTVRPTRQKEKSPPPYRTRADRADL